MERTNCGLHPLIHTMITFNLAQYVASQIVEIEKVHKHTFGDGIVDGWHSHRVSAHDSVKVIISFRHSSTLG